MSIDANSTALLYDIRVPIIGKQLLIKQIPQQSWVWIDSDLSRFHQGKNDYVGGLDDDPDFCSCRDETGG